MINDVLHYLKKLDFTEKVDDRYYENLRCAKRKLVDKFEDYNISKLVEVLSIVDNVVVTPKTGILQDILNKTDTPREIINI